MKKIAFITSYDPLSRLKRRINYFTDQYDCYLYYWNRDAESSLSMYKDWCNHVNEIKIKASTGNPIKRIPQTLKFKRIIKKELKTISPDVVLLQDLDMLISFTKFAKKRNIRVIYEVRDLHRYVVDKQKGIKRIIQKWLIRKENKNLKYVDLMIITSDAFYDKYYFNKIEKDKVLFIPNCPEGIDLSSFKEKNDKDFTIGFVGKIRYGNQILTLVDAAEEAGVYVLIKGYGLDDAKIQEYCKDKPFVTFGGRFDYNKDIIDIYSGVDAIYSAYDSKMNNVKWLLPNRLYDAIVFKKPIIVSEDTHLADVTNSLGVGVAIDPESKEDLVGVLNDWKKKDKSYKQFVDNCKKAQHICDTAQYRNKTLEIVNSFFEKNN